MPDALPPLDVDRAPELVAVAAGLGVAMDTDQAQRLIEFGQLLLRWNSAFNLVSRRDTHRLLARHLLDSLSIEPWLAPRPEAAGARGRILDVGTGAGLPGIPLAIVRPDLEFTLVDRNARKIRFVGQAARTLGLDHVTAVSGDVAAVTDAEFATVVSRAVADAATIWRLAAGKLRSGGRMLIMRHGQAGESGAAAPGPESAVAEPPDLSGLRFPAAQDGRAGQRVDAQQVALRIPGLRIAHRLLILQPTESTAPCATRKRL